MGTVRTVTSLSTTVLLENKTYDILLICVFIISMFPRDLGFVLKHFFQ